MVAACVWPDDGHCDGFKEGFHCDGFKEGFHCMHNILFHVSAHCE